MNLVKKCISTVSLPNGEDAILILRCQRKGFWHRFFGLHKAQKSFGPKMTVRATWDRKSAETVNPGDREGV